MKDLPVKEKAKKWSDFELAERFKEKSILKRINGDIHIFNGKYYEKLDHIGLEKEIIRRLKSELQTLTASKVKAVVYLIEREDLDESTPAEADGWRGFDDGAWNCFENRFVPFRGTPDTAFPVTSITYCLNARLFAGQLTGEARIPTLQELGLSRQENVTGYSQFSSYTMSYQGQTTVPYTMPVVNGYSNMRPDIFSNAPYQTPNIDQFLFSITRGNQELVARIWEMIGYILAPDTNGKVFFLLQGVPNSGKSVLGRFIEGFFPKGRVTSLDISRLGAKYYPKELFGSALNLSMDLPNKMLPLGAVANIKMMTGRDLMTFESKYEDARAYRGECKLLFSTNHRLKFREIDDAFLERIVCIPFEYAVDEGERDSHLLEKMNGERNYAAVKALSHYLALKENNYHFSGSFKAKIDGSISNSTVINRFVEDCCYFCGWDQQGTHTQILHESYKAYCEEHGYPALDSTAEFSRLLYSEYGNKIQSSRWRENGRNANGYKGIKLYKIIRDEDGKLVKEREV